MSKLYGQVHRELLAWLSGPWWNDGPALCWVEGFPGVGKTELHRHLVEALRSRSRPTAYYELPDDGADLMEPLLFTVAQELAQSGRDSLARKLDGGATQAAVQAELVKLLAEEQVLLVLDEFQFCLDGNGQPAGPLWSFLKSVRNRTGLKGRVLLLTDRHPHEGTWSENILGRRLPALDADEGAGYLRDLLEQQGRAATLPEERLADVVAWVDGNPRALRAVVAALRYEDLDSLVERPLSPTPGGWRNAWPGNGPGKGPPKPCWLISLRSETPARTANGRAKVQVLPEIYPEAARLLHGPCRRVSTGRFLPLSWRPAATMATLLLDGHAGTSYSGPASNSPRYSPYPSCSKSSLGMNRRAAEFMQ
jgi:hypothetical protein